MSETSDRSYYGANEQFTAARENQSPYGSSDKKRINLTPEEAKVLSNCARDAFKYKCLPLMLISGMTVHAAVKTGRLKPNPVMGSIPKVSAAVVVSFLFGRVAAIPECVERIKRLPNSPLAEKLRLREERRRPYFEGDHTHPHRPDHFQRNDDLVPRVQELGGDSDFSYPQADNVQHGGFHDAERPEQGRKKTFEELRQENRMQYAHSIYSKNLPNRPPSSPNPEYGIDPSFPPAPAAEPFPPPPAAGPEPRGYRRRPQETFKPVKKNAYGDNWEE